MDHELVLLLSTICASTSYTITEAGIFTELRDFVKKTNRKLGELFSCGYCMGHWVSFFLVFMYRPRIVQSDFAILDYFLTSLFIAWMSGFQWRAMVWSGKKIALLTIEREKLQSRVR